MDHMKHFEHLKIQLEAIKSATNNFADESCIGRGGFGKVYKGKIADFHGHESVALKRLDRRFGQGDPEFWKEIMMLSRYKHENIVSLLGFCDDCDEKILVYEYVPNKSLDLYLNNDKVSWIRRLKICVGAARGFAYLHEAIGTQQRVLHRDIKSANILLDKDMNAKISDFGLSKFGPANQEYTFLFSNAVGTHGYVDPLYAENGYLTKESDVYSFGVVLFEVLSGRLCIDYKNSNQFLVGLARKSYEQNKVNEIVYSYIKDEINPESLHVFAKIAYRCLKRDREERPLMTDVVTELEIALGYQKQNNHQAARSYLPPKPSEAIEFGHDNNMTKLPLAINDYGRGLLVVTIHEGKFTSRRKRQLNLYVGREYRREHRATKKTEKLEYPTWNEQFTFTVEKPTMSILRLILLSYPSWYQAFSIKENADSLDISIAEVVKEKHIDKLYTIGYGQLHVELLWKPLPGGVGETKSLFMRFMDSIFN